MKAWSGEVAHVKRCYTRGIPGRGCSSAWRTAGTAQSALGNLAWLYERQQRERAASATRACITLWVYVRSGQARSRPACTLSRSSSPWPKKERKAGDPVLVTVSPVPAQTLPTFASKIAWQWRNLYEHSKVAVWTKQYVNSTVTRP